MTRCEVAPGIAIGTKAVSDTHSTVVVWRHDAITGWGDAEYTRPFATPRRNGTLDVRAWPHTAAVIVAEWFIADIALIVATEYAPHPHHPRGC